MPREVWSAWTCELLCFLDWARLTLMPCGSSSLGGVGRHFSGSSLRGLPLQMHHRSPPLRPALHGFAWDFAQIYIFPLLKGYLPFCCFLLRDDCEKAFIKSPSRQHNHSGCQFRVPSATERSSSHSSEKEGCGAPKCLLPSSSGCSPEERRLHLRS